MLPAGRVGFFPPPTQEPRTRGRGRYLTSAQRFLVPPLGRFTGLGLGSAWVPGGWMCFAMGSAYHAVIGREPSTCAGAASRSSRRIARSGSRGTTSASGGAIARRASLLRRQGSPAHHDPVLGGVHGLVSAIVLRGSPWGSGGASSRIGGLRSASTRRARSTSVLRLRRLWSIENGRFFMPSP